MLEVKKKIVFLFHYRAVENFDHEVAIWCSQKGFRMIFVQLSFFHLFFTILAVCCSVMREQI